MGARRFIPAAEVPQARSWALPVMDGGEAMEETASPSARARAATPPPAPEAERPRPPTAEELEAISREARDEGYRRGLEEGRAKGHAEGLRKARAELAEKGRALDAVLQAFEAPLAELDDDLEQALVGLALAVGKHLVRRELRADPGQVVAVVREAVQALPVATGRVQVSLHPEDAALVREALALAEGEARWELVEDPVMSRGGCKVTSGASRIDATVETRVAAVVARILGEEREHDGSDRQ
jgi:flagellar assembly protein FliH